MCQLFCFFKAIQNTTHARNKEQNKTWVPHCRKKILSKPRLHCSQMNHHCHMLQMIIFIKQIKFWMNEYFISFSEIMLKEKIKPGLLSSLCRKQLACGTESSPIWGCLQKPHSGQATLQPCYSHHWEWLQHFQIPPSWGKKNPPSEEKVKQTRTDVVKKVMCCAVKLTKIPLSACLHHKEKGNREWCVWKCQA